MGLSSIVGLPLDELPHPLEFAAVPVLTRHGDGLDERNRLIDRHVLEALVKGSVEVRRPQDDVVLVLVDTRRATTLGGDMVLLERVTLSHASSPCHRSDG